WSAWRLWSGEPAVYVGWVEAALLAVVALIFVRAGTAPYIRPAWLVAWEWLGMALLLFLVRQLAARPEERHSLLAVVLASAVALAGEGGYQPFVALPRQAAEARNEKPPVDTQEFLTARLKESGIQPSPAELHELTQRLDRRLAHGPYFHPGSLAAVLALALPALAGAFVASRRGGGPTWQTVFVAVCVVFVATILFRTGDRAALLAVIAAGLGTVGILVWPARLGGWKVGLPLAVAIVAALVYAGV